jgi:DNA-binding NtrC family response regulator
MTNPKQPETELPMILFADDEVELQKLIGSELPRMGFRVTVCPNGSTALAALEKQEYDCLLVDLDMPGMSGLQVIDKAKQLYPLISTVVLTGKPSQETAIGALKFEAVDYLTKPCRLSDLAKVLGGAVARREAKRKLAVMEHRLRRAEGDSQMIGDHPLMQRLRKLITKVAPTESTVLIRGETGSGKELAARAVHDQSKRSDQPYVAVNCGALPETLIESELFGHSKGAFTGADATRTGLFQLAHGGTLFLDEIGELPLAMQAKLLRVLETGEIRRLGDDRTTNVDVRIVTATHRDLEQMVREGEFREDLMYRINTFELYVPPLRERKEDIPKLALHLLKRHRPDIASSVKPFTDEAAEMLQGHVWPGNVRELANIIEHAAILCEKSPIDVEHLPQHFRSRRLRSEIAAAGPLTLNELELQAIHKSMLTHDGNKAAVAAELGISLKTLYNKLSHESVAKKAG